MSRLNYSLVLALIAATILIVDLGIALRTGHVRGRDGSIARDRQPDGFKRYIYSNYVALAICAVVIFWALFRPYLFN